MKYKEVRAGKVLHIVGVKISREGAVTASVEKITALESPRCGAWGKVIQGRTDDPVIARMDEYENGALVSTKAVSIYESEYRLSQLLMPDRLSCVFFTPSAAHKHAARFNKGRLSLAEVDTVASWVKFLNKPNAIFNDGVTCYP